MISFTSVIPYEYQTYFSHEYFTPSDTYHFQNISPIFLFGNFLPNDHLPQRVPFISYWTFDDFERPPLPVPSISFANYVFSSREYLLPYIKKKL